MKTVSARVILLGIFLSSAALYAQPDVDGVTSPYAAISRRNVFDLKPPIIEEPPPMKPPELPAQVVLVGAKDWDGVRSAILTVQVPAKPGQPPSSKTYTIKEGDTQGPITVVRIASVKTGEMQIVNNGTTQEIAFKTHAGKLQATGLPGMPMLTGVPGIVQQPGLGVTTPLPLPNVAPQPNMSRVLPPTAPRPTASDAASSIRPLRAPSAQGSRVGMQFVNPGPVVQPQPPPPQPAEPQMSREVQAIMIEIERARTQPLVEKGVLPPLPPTEITPPAPGQ